MKCDNAIIKGTRGKIQQVVMNLLSNARDTISDANRNNGEIKISTSELDGSVILEICDNGNGIEKDNLQHIFDTFYTTKSPGEGTGLGLSIVHSIIVQLKGEISADSKPGFGSTFRISLPLISERETTTPKTSPTKYQKLPLRVLVVDDEEDLRDILATQLIGIVSTLETASDGNEALEKIKAGSFDVVISDLKMPNFGGVKLIETLHKSGDTKTKVVVLTGEVGLTPPEGAFACLTKPHTKEILYLTLKECMK